MGRQPDGNYLVPDGTYGTTDQTVYSARYNNWVNDVAATFNAVLPVNKGGTGASTPDGATTNLGAVAKAGDTMTGNLTIGKADPALLLRKTAATQAAFIQGYLNLLPRWLFALGDNSPEPGSNVGSDVQLYRYDDAGVLIGATLTIKRSNGEATFGGDIRLTKAEPFIRLNKTASGQAQGIKGDLNGVPRWVLNLGDGTAESGTKTGSNLSIARFNNDGTIIGEAMSIYRDTGNVQLNGNTTVNNGFLVVTGTTPTQGLIYFGGSGTKYLHYDGGNFNLVGGGLIMSGGIQSGGLTTTGNVQGGNLIAYASSTTGAVYFGAPANGKYLEYNGTNYNLAGGGLLLAGHALQANSWAYLGGFNAGGLTPRAGVDLAIGWNSSGGQQDVGFVNTTAAGLEAFRFWKQTGASTKTQIATMNANASFVAYNTIETLNSGVSFSHGFQSGNDVCYWGRTDGSGGFVAVYFEVRSTNIATTRSVAYKPGGGPWNDSSDAHIKNVTGNYDNGLDAILTLQPVKFTYKGNDTRAAPSNKSVSDPEEKEDKSAVTVPYVNSPHYDVALNGKEFIGLVAQDCEQAMPEIVTKREGYIDGVAVTDVRDLDTGPLLFALINAVKTLAARVAELEAR